MKKLIKSLKWIDNNLVHFTVIFFIVAVSLLPKIPFKNIEYTYIKFRLDDFLPAFVGVIFLIQFLRRKITLNTKFLVIFCLYWLAVFLSFFVGAYIKNTIVVEGIGYLHSMRRIEYMFIFFIASSAITSERRFKQYMVIYLVVLGIVAAYGLGQRFFQFPSIQSMNPAYSDGRVLFLNKDDRINSTFGGHFDFAGYLTFSFPIIFGFYYGLKNRTFITIYFLSFIALLYTSMRSAFGAYILTVPLFFAVNKKFKMLAFILVTSAILTVLTGQMIKRFRDTLAVKTVYVNTQTSQTTIHQKNSPKDLPHGGPNIVLPFLPRDNSAIPVDPGQIQIVAIEQAQAELKQQGKKLNTAEIGKRADEISKFIKPQKSLLCDISCSVRLQVEWPRAIGAFLYNPLVGTGPSSITEATDNDIFRSFGEVGIIGSFFFFFILFSICRYVLKAKKFVKGDEKMIYSGFVFGVVALLLNAFYVDVFEASKVAYNFWMVAGFYVGVSHLIINDTKEHDKRRAQKSS